MIKQIAVLLFASLLASPLLAQQTTIYTEAYKTYKRGVNFYDTGLYGKAQDEFREVIRLLQPTNEPEHELLKTKAELFFAKSAVQLELPEGEKLILDFVRNKAPDPISNQALIEIANYYFNAKDYDKAVEYYAKIPTSGMSRDQRSKVRFQLGYALFVQKRFTKAQQNFEAIKTFQNEYFYPTNYYLGLCYFFDGEYRDAIKSFKVVEKSKRYSPHIPYYLCQIYFAEGQYKDLIKYAMPKLQERNLRKIKEIHQLVGQSYFEEGEYNNAIYYLEYYAERSSKLRPEEFYQLGFTQYQVAKDTENNLSREERQITLEKAVKSFKELSGQDSKIAQHAMYSLGDIYIQLGDKYKARNAFADAKRLNYDSFVKEEALFQYAKLSYELKFNREALQALLDFQPDSKYYMDAQTLMSDIFLSFKDYQKAMELIEGLPEKTPQIRETYQQVTFLRGLQVLKDDNDTQKAKNLFNKSLQYPIDPRTKALSLFWLADIAHREKRYNASIQQLNQFLTLAKTLNNLPDESSIFNANYIQGYNYLKQKNYTAALGFFQEAVAGIKRNRSFIRNQQMKDQILGDAILRAGDCFFKRKQYNDAVVFYNEAISKRYTGHVYAIYQKAIIEGLRGRVTEKILALENLANNYEKSSYADDALLALGQTYQEIGQLNKAIPPLRRLINDYRDKSPLVNKAYLALGLISYNQGNLQGAINYYKRIFSNNPDDDERVAALQALEEIYVDDLGDADSYFAFLESLPGYDNLNDAIRDSINFKAAEAQFENAKYERAIQAYTDYILKFPPPKGRYTREAHYHRAESYAVLKRYDEAFVDYEYIVSLGQTQYYLKALEKAAIIAYNHRQNFAKSFDLYSQLELAATSPELRFEAQLGALRSAYRVGNASAVYDLAGKVLNNPSATQSQTAAANFYLGKMAYDEKDYDNALEAFQQVIRLSDNELTAEARYLEAYIYYLRRNLERAQELCLSANSASSGYPYWAAKSVILLSDIFAEKGDIYNARAALEALLENYTEDPELVQEAQRKLDQLNNQIDNSSRLLFEKDPNIIEFDEDGDF